MASSGSIANWDWSAADSSPSSGDTSMSLMERSKAGSISIPEGAGSSPASDVDSISSAGIDSAGEGSISGRASNSGDGWTCGGVRGRAGSGEMDVL